MQEVLISSSSLFSSILINVVFYHVRSVAYETEAFLTDTFVCRQFSVQKSVGHSFNS